MARKKKTVPRSEAAKQIADWMKTKGLKQQHLADMLGISQATVWNWLAGRKRPSADQWMKLSDLASDPSDRDAFKLRAFESSGLQRLVDDPSAILRIAHLPVEPLPVHPGSEDVVLVNQLEDKVAAGTPREVSERDVKGQIGIPQEWFKRNHNLVAMTVATDSMSPIVEPGYIVIVDTTERDPKRLVRKMVVAREGGGIAVKWLRKAGQTLLLVPQNTSTRHEIKILGPDEDWAIVGEVIRFVGEPPKPRR